jgi:hypothetical protein
MPLSKQDFLGHWTLVECVREKPGAAPSYLMGAKARGAILYTPDYMAALLEHDTGQYASYGGPWSFDGTCVHHEASFNSEAARIGQMLTREAVLDGDMLTLSTIPKAEGEARLVLRWRRG